jgi:hypothetical protein
VPLLIVFVALTVVQILPSVPRYMGLTASMALGTAIAAPIMVGLYLCNWAASPRQHREHDGYIDASFAVVLAIGLLALPVHGVIADILHPVHLNRLAGSLGLMGLLIAGALALGGILRHAAPAHLDRSLRLSFALMCVVIVLEVAGVQPGADRWDKPMFPFSEPSHFTLAFLPLLLYRCTSATNRGRFAWVLAGLLIALSIKSLTLLAGCVLAAVACRRVLATAVVGGMAAVLGLGAALLDLGYFTQRLGLGEGSNLSGLVYLQGWELIGESLQLSSNWGLGFQQLGLDGTNVPAASAIYALAGDNLNLQDGSFLLSKLLSELGVFGAIIALAYCVVAIRSLVALRRRHEPRPVVRFARCVMVAYLVELLVRGPGYFTGSALLMVAAAGVLATVPATYGDADCRTDTPISDGLIPIAWRS